MPDYLFSKIYKLTHPDTDEVYIGSTCQKYLSSRLQQHKRDFKSYKKGKTPFVTSFKLFELGADDVQIELIECCPCSCREELNKKEGENIKKHKCVNKRVEGRTKEEYREDNKEIILKQKKDYREANKEIILEKQKIYYQNHIEERAIYHKEYREKNELKLKEKQKEYHEKNKEQIKANRSKQVKCECGAIVTNSHLSRHKKTQKHIDAI
jgi:hypothetical protein